MKILILGAAGGMSLATIKDLLTTSKASKIILSDIDAVKVKKRAELLGDKRLVPIQLNLTEIAKTAEAMRDVDVVINESSYQLNIHAMKAAMQAKVPLIDLGGLYVMTKKQLKMHEEVKKRGILIIPGIGSDPGTSNVLCRYGANKLDTVEEIKIRFGASWSGQTFTFAIETILDEAIKDAVIFENSRYKKVPALSRSEDVVFRDPVGIQKTYVILHSELASVPDFIAGVKKVSYYDTWNPETIQKVKSLIDFGLLSDKPAICGETRTTFKKATIQLLSQLAAKEKASKGYDDLKVFVSGTAGGTETTYAFEVMTPGKVAEGITPTGYSTGIPPSIAAQMVAAGDIGGEGVLPPEACIDPEKYLRELTKRDFAFYETKTQTRKN